MKLLVHRPPPAWYFRMPHAQFHYFIFFHYFLKFFIEKKNQRSRSTEWGNEGESAYSKQRRHFRMLLNLIFVKFRTVRSNMATSSIFMVVAILVRVLVK